MNVMRGNTQLVVTLITVLMVMAIQPAHGQDVQPLYVIVDYISADDGPVYLEAEQKWKVLHQHMVNEGVLMYWGLYRVAYPRGSAQSYNYATVRIYKDFAQVDAAVQEAVYRERVNEMNQDGWADFIASTSASREVVKGEVFEVVSTTGNDYQAMGRYVEVDYMDTPEGEEATKSQRGDKQ